MNGEPSTDAIAKPAPAWRGLGPLAEIAVRAGWLPCLVFVSHVFLYSVVRLYDRLPRLDLPMHFAGGVAIAYFFTVTIGVLRRRGAVAAIDDAVFTALVFALTVTAAVFWEFGEYSFDALMGTRLQADLADTLSDLALGALGGIGFLLARWLAPGRPTPPL